MGKGEWESGIFLFFLKSKGKSGVLFEFVVYFYFDMVQVCKLFDDIQFQFGIYNIFDVVFLEKLLKQAFNIIFRDIYVKIGYSGLYFI